MSDRKSKFRKHDDLYTMVTPEIAAELLNRNSHNRPLRPGVVEKYARDMLGGLWEKNAQPVTIDWNDAIHNGQHRLFAVVMAGETNPKIQVPLIVLTGLDPDSVLTVDAGAPRNFGDYKKLTGGDAIKNVNNYSAALRLIHWYENRWPAVRLSSGRDSAPTHHELREIERRYPHLSECVNTVQAKNGALRHIMNPTMLGFLYGVIYPSHPNEGYHWLSTMWTNEGDPNNPAISLRSQFTRARLAHRSLDRSTVMCFIIKSWNAFALGEKLTQYVWRDNEPMPAIYGTSQYTGKLAGHKAVAAIAETGDKRTGRRAPKRASK